MSQVFAFQNKSVRTVTENSEIWFVAKDVCTALDISWSSATLKPIPDEWKGVMNFITPSGDYRGGGKQRLAVIAEQGLYMLAFRSNKESALALTRWVAGEVLPSIRQTGGYAARPKQAPLPPVPPKPARSARDITMCAEFMGCYEVWRRNYDEAAPLRSAVVHAANRVSLHHSDPQARNAVYALQELLYHMDMLGNSIYHAMTVARAVIG